MDKDTLIEIREQFTKMRNAIEEYHKDMQNIKEHKLKIKNDDNVFSKEYNAQRLKELETTEKVLKQNNREAIALSREALIQKLGEVVSRPIDPTDTRLKNAIDLIRTGALDWDAAKKLNMSFKGDQTELKILKRAYEEAGLPDGGIQKMVMPNSIDEIGRNISEMTYHVTQQGGHVNELGRVVGQVADWFGVDDVSWTIDPNGFDQALRAGAGLSVDLKTGQVAEHSAE